MDDYIFDLMRVLYKETTEKAVQAILDDYKKADRMSRVFLKAIHKEVLNQMDGIDKGEEKNKD